MDSLVASAARLLAAGDPLGALKRVALRDDPPALALRGIAMAQLGDYERARKLLRRAARGFGARERLAQARCQVAEAEIALAARDLTRPVHMLDATARVLDVDQFWCQRNGIESTPSSKNVHRTWRVRTVGFWDVAYRSDTTIALRASCGAVQAS